MLGVVSSLVSAIAWPVVALIIALQLLKKAGASVFIERVFRRTTELSVLGWQIKMSEGATATIDDLGKLIAQVPETHKEWVANSHLHTQFDLTIGDLKTYLTTDICDSGPPLSQEDFGRFRFTLHVPDVVLEHSLRHLVAYVGSDRGKAGRLFSARRGIIGKAWRLHISQHEAKKRYTEEDLIADWGMTRPEAKDTTGGKKVYLAVCIKNKRGLPLAVLYADSSDSALFKPERIGERSPEHVFDLFEKKVLEVSRERGLTASLLALERARLKVKQFDPYEVKSS
jgi:hypothetical protein